ncbi:MAG TPA: sugar transferase [Solirubrobacteraceae bacterium]|jgi:lipopolysaccharide/colanic/teichoic acid biosynthesis glycosyltransferase|nr:sugar transferase [Solirubrobacteraceae bacterium]
MSVAPTQPARRTALDVCERPALHIVPDAPADSSAGARPARRPLVADARRALDLLVASVLLLVLAPLLAAIALAIRIDSRGPALFRQRRVGRNRKEFTIFKFRTMRCDADIAPHRRYVQSLIDGPATSERGRLYKLSVDDRVTRVGRVLRSWSLDELPQLFNVLRGEMALVGPRPVIPYEVDIYPDAYLRRFAVKPGLTGLWQVSGRNERTYDEMVRFDIEYAESASLLLDLRILARTVPVVLGRQGVA